MPSTMNAVRIHGRRPPRFLEEDVPIPQLAAGDELVRVHRAGKLQSHKSFEAVHQTMNDHEL
jgi:hypothetical protein